MSRRKVLRDSDWNTTFPPRAPSYPLERLHTLLWPRLPRAVQARSCLDFLRLFFGAARRKDLSPQAVAHPSTRG